MGVVSVSISPISAASITNGNFDTDSIGSFSQAAPTGWTHSSAGSNGGLLNIAINGTAITTGHSLNNVAWLSESVTLSQAISENVADNLSLELQFKVGTRADGAGLATDFEAGLFTTAGAELAKATVANVGGGLTSGEVKAVTLAFNAGTSHAQNGQAIEIRLISTSGNSDQIVFDDVTISAVPEPATYALISGLGLVGMAAYRRRKLNKA